MNLRQFVFPVLSVILPATAQTPDKVSALIEQLAAPKVRLRDEAQAALAALPQALPAMREAAEQHPSAEARLRAQRLLKDFRENAWQMQVEVRPAAPAGLTCLREAVVSPDGTLFAGVHRGGVDVYETATGKPVRRVGSPYLPAKVSDSVQRSLAISPDGKRIASTDHTHQVFVDDLSGTRLYTLPAEKTKRTVRVTTSAPAADPFSSSPNNVTVREIEQIAETQGLAFLPDGKGLVVFTTAGLAVHDFNGAERRLLPMPEIFTVTGFTIAARTFGISADGKTVGLGVEVMGSKDRAALVSVPELKLTAQWLLPVVPCSIAVKNGGAEALVGLRDSTGVHRCLAGEEWGRPLHRMQGWVSGIAYAPDESYAMISASDATTPLRQVALPSGEEIWSAPPLAKAEDVAFAGAGRVVVSYGDDVLRVWVHRDFSATPTPAPR
jgi:hypothetical protein